ncbi:MAG: DUF3450 family protein [Clostridia bacterium]|nr:DUF3450 family protein [Clostridia bacterium]
MRLFKKIVSTVICLCLIAVSLGIFVPENSLNVSAATSSELQNKINSLNEKQKKIQKKLDSLKDDKADAKEKAENLQDQVDVIETKVDTMTAKVNALGSEIEDLESQINKKESQIKKAKNQLKERLKAIYIAGASTDVLVLLSADDYSDFLEKSDIMKCITSDTKDLMGKLQKDIKKINKAKKQVEAKKSEADSLKQQLVTEKSNLDSKYKEAESAYSKLADTESALKEESAEIIKEKEAAQAEFDRIAREAAKRALAARNSSSSSRTPNVKIGSSGFTWPYGGSSYYISSGFGYRYHPTMHYNKLHGGVDITGGGAYGTPILATASGTVILASYNGSYGNCVMIDHGIYQGSSLISLYGHCSSLAVGSGQSVKQGQVIAYVGSTGRSTGPHLHFEMRVNGNRVNPLNYF